MTHLAEVVTLYDINPNDVPGMLRDLAEQTESGLHGENVRVVLVLDSEFGIDVRHAGKITGLEAQAVLNLGLARLVNRTLANLADDDE